MTERSTGALPLRDGGVVVMPGHAPYPRSYTNASVQARAQARGVRPAVAARQLAFAGATLDEITAQAGVSETMALRMLSWASQAR